MAENYCDKHQMKKIKRGGQWVCPLCIADNENSPVATAISDKMGK